MAPLWLPNKQFYYLFDSALLIVIDRFSVENLLHRQHCHLPTYELRVHLGGWKKKTEKKKNELIIGRVL